MGAITLHTVTARAQDIRKTLTHGFDDKKAKQEAKLLYQEGIQLILAYLHGKPLFKDNEPILIKF